MFKHIRTLVLVFAIVLSSSLTSLAQEPAQDQASAETDASMHVYLPFISRSEAVVMAGSWLEVSSLTAAQQAQLCGSALPTYTPAVTAAQATEDICLLPGRFPVVTFKLSGQMQAIGLGGWKDSTTRTAWNLTTGIEGSRKIRGAEVLQLLSWPEGTTGVPQVGDGNVVVLEFNSTPQYDNLSAATTLQSGPQPGSFLEFVENLMQYADKYGANGISINVPSTQVFVNEFGLPGRTPAQCGANPDDGANVIPIGPSTMMFTGVGVRLAFKVLFTDPSPIPGHATMGSCMNPYNYISVGDLMLLPAYEPLRQELRDKGYNSWEQFTSWQVLRPDPQTIYVLSWIAAGGASIYTVAKYSASGLLNTASSFLIIPEDYLECTLVGEIVCKAEPVQSLLAN